MQYNTIEILSIKENVHKRYFTLRSIDKTMTKLNLLATKIAAYNSFSMNFFTTEFRECKTQSASMTSRIKPKQEQEQEQERCIWFDEVFMIKRYLSGYCYYSSAVAVVYLYEKYFVEQLVFAGVYEGMTAELPYIDNNWNENGKNESYFSHRSERNWYEKR